MAGFLPSTQASFIISITYDDYFGRISAKAKEQERRNRCSIANKTLCTLPPPCRFDPAA